MARQTCTQCGSSEIKKMEEEDGSVNGVENSGESN